jgi:hypothetical protein
MMSKKESMMQKFLAVRSGNARVRVVAISVALSVFGVGALLASAQTVTPSPATTCPATTPASSTSNSESCVTIGEFDIYF